MVRRMCDVTGPAGHRYVMLPVELLLDRSMPPRTAEVYAAIADCGRWVPAAGEYVNAYPAAETICTRLAMSRASVFRCIAALEAGGWLVRVARGGRGTGRSSNGYTLRVGTPPLETGVSAQVGGNVSPEERGNVSAEHLSADERFPFETLPSEGEGATSHQRNVGGGNVSPEEREQEEPPLPEVVPPPAVTGTRTDPRSKSKALDLDVPLTRQDQLPIGVQARILSVITPHDPTATLADAKALHHELITNPNVVNVAQAVETAAHTGALVRRHLARRAADVNARSLERADLLAPTGQGSYDAETVAVTKAVGTWVRNADMKGNPSHRALLGAIHRQAVDLLAAGTSPEALLLLAERAGKRNVDLLTYAGQVAAWTATLEETDGHAG